MAKYGEKAKEKVGAALHEEKRGTLKSGTSGKKVTSRKQAIAIGLSEARAKGQEGAEEGTEEAQDGEKVKALTPSLSAKAIHLSARG